LNIRYFEEKKLKFGNNVEALDPRIGLLKGGPYNLGDSSEFKIIDCGIIGTGYSIAKLKIFFEKKFSYLKANDKTYGKLGFPGIGKRSPLKFTFRILKVWEAQIYDDEIQDIIIKPDRNDQKNSLIDLIEKKIKRIKHGADPPPELILIPLPEEFFKLFKRDNVISNDIIFANRNKPKTVYDSQGDINLHNIIKILGMKYDVVTQIIKPDTLNNKANEDEVTVVWNLSVSLLYKARKIPWKFSKFEDNTCYMGIGFYRDFSQSDVTMNASMAQVFLSTGDSFILTGDKFIYTTKKEDLEPRLDHDNATSIINKVLDFYNSQKSNYPSRLVIHKTSNYSELEINGFFNNKANLKNIDLITIQEDSKIRLYRQAKYPVMRGTALISEDRTECILYTVGHIPSLGTYPGMGIPKPIIIRKFTGNSDIEVICKEILTLTRLDWNTIKFNQKLPVTIKFPKKVSSILAERRINQITMKNHYRYYM